ncbi:MAG: hypothetical protein VB144_03160 [Clostridia bacterium]|nr:hypothetical protein [Clostridia bacterium]
MTENREAGGDREARLARAEERLLTLPGVVRVRVLAAVEGDEIHVMVAGQLDQDEIKRMKKDIETVYLLEVGEKVDYRRVSIAQVGEAPESGTNALRRPVLSRVAIEYGPKHSMIGHVTLDYEGESFCGTACGCAVNDSVDQVMKHAALEAVQALLGAKYRLQADCSIIGDRVITEVTIIGRDSGERRRYIGAAYKKDDLPTSVVRSILQALNRQLERAADLQ